MIFDLVIASVPGRAQSLHRLLESVERQRLRPRRVTLVAEEGAPVPATTLPGVVVHRVRPGTGRGARWTVAADGADVVAILDDDLVISPIYFQRAAECFARHGGAVSWGGQRADGRYMRWTDDAADGDVELALVCAGVSMVCRDHAAAVASDPLLPEYGAKDGHDQALLNYHLRGVRKWRPEGPSAVTDRQEQFSPAGSRGRRAELSYKLWIERGGPMNLMGIGIGGVNVVVRPGTWDADIAREVIESDVYRARGWVPRNPVTVFDVGGHVGSFTKWMSTRLPQMRAFVFEMDEANQQVLEANVGGIAGVTIVKAALGAKTGVAWRSPVQIQNTGGAGVLWDASAGAAQVPTVGIADFMQQHEVGYIDLLKLDCEGSEFQILEALQEMPGGVRARVGCVRAEVHAAPSDPRHKRFMEILRANFPFVDSAGSGSLYMAFGWR